MIRRTYMELKQLKFYLTCVECGSLGKAAEKLYTTQPNVSKVIHALEDELGGELFERTPKGMILTSFGKTIYEYAKTCVQSADALQNIGKYQQTDTFSVSTYRSNTLAKLLAQQYRCDPSVVIEHQQGTVDEILDRVERGISEIGILYIARRQYKAFLNVLHHKKLEFHLLDYRDTCVYAGPNSPIYDRSSVTFEELPQMKFIRNLNDTFSIQNGLEHIELGVVSPQQLHTVGHLTGTPITVVLPEDVPQAKMLGVEKMGGTVIPAPRDYNKRMAVAYEQVEKNGYTMVHAYENYGVMAGQGTIGLEILEDLEDVDTVIVPVSGGGMMSGIATAIKSLKPEVKVIGAQASNSDGYAASWRAGKWATIVTQATLADGLTCEEPSEPNYSIMKKYVDDFVTADEDSIRTAVKLIASEAKLMAEPSACVGVGAVLSGSYKPQPNEKICFVLSGGNWDVNMIGKILNDEPVSGVM